VRVQIFRHIPFESAGHIERILEGCGIAFDYADVFREGAAVPDGRDAAGLIFMGGPMSANDGFAYIRAELEVIARAIGRGQPLLGVCLGAQLIAKAAGARVFRNPEKEIGWFDVHVTDEGARDPLFRCFDPPESVFHWHGETFDLPAGATWLAWSERCRHQAFRIGSNVYGLQFHLEVTPEMIADWCGQDANCGDMRELDAPPEPARNRQRLLHLSEQVFGAWCRLL